MSINSVLKFYETALNANNIEAILDLYGSEPVFMPQRVPALMGREAVRAGYAHVFSTIKLAIAFDIHEVEELGDLAWARTSSAGTQTLLATGESRQEGNNELFILRKEGGSWKIHRYLFATNQPPPG